MSLFRICAKYSQTRAYTLPVRRRTTSSDPLTKSFIRRNMSTSSTDENPFKRAKTESTLQPSTKVIGTHSGTFQADEAMGVWLLRQLPEYYQSNVVRSRDLEVLNKLDIVLDVGEYLLIC